MTLVVETPSDWNYFADLDDGVTAEVFALIGDEVRSSGGESGVEVEHGFEVEVADGVIVRGGAGWEGADAAINFDTDEAASSEESASDGKMLAEVVIPVEGGTR